jgi:MFS family permease
VSDDVTDSASTGVPSQSDATDSRTGWRIVVVSFFTLFFTWGTVFTFSVYANALGTTFGLSAIQTSTIYSIQLFVFFIAGGLVAIFVSRLRLRFVMGVVAGVAALGVGLVQFADSFLSLAVALSFVGASAGTTFVIIISLIPQWFDEYQGRAMGIAIVGNGLGVQVLPYVWLRLLRMGGVRFAYLVIGGSFVTALLAAVLVFRRPYRESDDAASRGVTWPWVRQLTRDPRFRFAIVGVPLVWAWYHVLSAHLVDILITTGIERTAAASAFGFMGGVSIVSRLASGVVADSVGIRRTLVASILITVTSLLIAPLGPTFAFASIVGFGVGLGGVATLYSPALVRAFGPENATAVNGVFQLSLGVSGLLSPVAMSSLVATTGTYRLPLVLLAGVTTVGIALFWYGTRPDGNRPQLVLG